VTVVKLCGDRHHAPVSAGRRQLHLRQAPGESTPDFLARAMREDHGFTVPSQSLRAPDVVEDQE